jgi:hypothetical protein
MAGLRTTMMVLTANAAPHLGESASHVVSVRRSIISISR